MLYFPSSNIKGKRAYFCCLETYNCYSTDDGNTLVEILVFFCRLYLFIVNLTIIAYLGGYGTGDSILFGAAFLKSKIKHCQRKICICYI